jgi:hypothetical protein
MKCGKTKHIECNYPLISLISPESLDNYNHICHTHYTKGEVKNQTVVKRKQEDPEYWKKLMESNRGLEVNDDL